MEWSEMKPRLRRIDHGRKESRWLTEVIRMVKEFCDICGEQLDARSRYTRYKLKTEDLWYQNGWVQLVIHDKCWKEMCKVIKEKRNES